VKEVCGRVLIECVRKGGCETRICMVTVSSTGMSEGAGGRARGSAGCRAGWLWERERQRDAQREGPGAA
jgi:hypothetical protein